jgi:Ran GTPase-activating protein (RanGAP) involved in mRNA processing and transport
LVDNEDEKFAGAGAFEHADKIKKIKNAFQRASGDEVRMRNWWLTAAEVPDIFEGLRENLKVTVLDLSFNLLRPKGLARIAEALTTETRLEVLDLSGNRGKIGVLHLAEALQYNRVLRELDISLNEIDEKGMLYLMAALKEHTHRPFLGVVNIQGNDVTPAVIMAIKDLKETRPKLTFMTGEYRRLPSLQEGRSP